MYFAPCPRALALATSPATSHATGPAHTSSRSFQTSPLAGTQQIRASRRRRAAPGRAASSRRPRASARPARSRASRCRAGSTRATDAGRRAGPRASPGSRSIGARSPGKPASAACSVRRERPSSPGSGGGACSSCGTNFHSVIHNPSRWCGPGGRMSLGATARSVRSARNEATATSRASHCSVSSCKTAVPVITRATTGAGFRCTSTLLPAAIRTASSQATPCSRATACAAASAAASPVRSAVMSPARVPWEGIGATRQLQWSIDLVS